MVRTGGRQAKEKGRPRRTVIQVAVSAEDAIAIKKVADAAGESISNWCYKPIKARLKRESK